MENPGQSRVEIEKRERRNTNGGSSCRIRWEADARNDRASSIDLPFRDPIIMRHTLPFARRAAAVLLLLAVGCLKGTEPATPSNPATETFAASLGVDLSKMTKVSEDLYYQDIVVGTGTTAAVGQTINVFYTGWLANGTQFNSNVGKTLLSRPIGVGALIPGWDVGVPGMKAGGKRRLVIGSNLGYGPGGSPPVIPGNATLVFDVQLVSVQ